MVILMPDINALATKKAISVIHTKNTNFQTVDEITPEYFTETHEGQHPMFTSERMWETNGWLKACGLNVLNCPTEHTTHFNVGVALHAPDHELVERL